MRLPIWQWVASRTRFRSKWNSDVAISLYFSICLRYEYKNFHWMKRERHRRRIYSKHHAKITFFFCCLIEISTRPSRRAWYRAHLIDFNVQRPEVLSTLCLNVKALMMLRCTEVTNTLPALCRFWKLICRSWSFSSAIMKWIYSSRDLKLYN